MMRSGGRSVTAFSAASPRADNLRFGVAAPFERVLDQAGDVVLVFDDEDAVSGHQPAASVPAGRFADRIEAVKCGLTGDRLTRQA